MPANLTLGSLLLLGLASAAPTAAAQTLLIRNVRVFDGRRTLERRSVLVQDGLIARIGGADLASPPGTEIVDGTSRTLLPGLIDSHVHISEAVEEDLRQAAVFGVTTVLDMWNGGPRYQRMKALQSSDPPGMASLRSAGLGATAPGGHPSQMGGPPFPTIGDSAGAQAFVDARLVEGSDYLKIIYDDIANLRQPLPTLDRNTVAGLVAAAHRRGKLAVVHIGRETEARVAIEVGADGLVHLFVGDTVAKDFAATVARHRAFVIPTLGVLHAVCGHPTGGEVVADPLLRPYIRTALRSRMTIRFDSGRPTSCAGTDQAVRDLAKHQVPILAGTDSPVPGQTYGASLHGELLLLTSVGLTPVQALIAATSAPARAFGLADRGEIRPGLRADLVLFDGDPTHDILATRRINAVWKRGIRVERTAYPE